MGVMQCDRRGCEEIMCDRCILDRTAYICSGCYAELCKAKEHWPQEMPLNEVRERIEKFMDTIPGSYYVVKDEQINSEFNRLMGDYNSE